MNLSRKPKLEKSYHIPLPIFDKAFRAYQKKYVYPRNYILIAILFAIGCLYVKAAVDDPSNTLAYFLVVICLAMILILIYNPLKIRRSLMLSLKELENDIYTLSLYDDGVTVRTEDAPTEEETVAQIEPETDEETQKSEETTNADGFNELFEEEEITVPAEPIAPTELPFGPGLKIHEYDEFFILYLVKHNFYVVPKKDFSEAEISQMRKAFSLTESK